ncbi:recombinase family protein [Paenibacillus alvei]|uniref:recombinase family protein n=1 Tax=Paenibacillus alvei TaxID=44250 RepID=UPI0013D9DC13|nr:recombinase family protein [Paenibacillus alvei]
MEPYNVLALEEYLIYLRKSRSDLEAEERGEGETFARHEKTLLELSKRLKINVTAIYREIVSGETIDERPEMQRVLKEVEDGKWAGVLVMEVERLARGDTVDQGIVAQVFKYNGTKIITPMKTYDPNNEYDEEYFEFGLFMSRREFKTINRRLQRGRLASIEEGKYVGNVAPYGYERYKLIKEKGYSLKIIEEQANVVRLIFELYTKGEQDENGNYIRLGTQLIANKLTDLKIPTVKGGKEWSVPTIRGILRNPVYIGKIKWGTRPIVKKRKDGKVVKSRPRAKCGEYKLYDGRHEAIIDNEVFEKAQSILSENDVAPVPQHSTIKNPLAGLAICGVCGKKMSRRPYSNGYPDTLICPASRCKNVSSFLTIVEQKVLDGLKTWLAAYRAEWKNHEEKQDVSSSSNFLDIKRGALKQIEKDIIDINLQLGNLHDLLEQKVYSVEKFLERSNTLTARLSESEAAYSKLKDEIEKQSSRETAQEKIVPMVEYVINAYPLTTNPELKNNLLKSVLDKVVYTKEKSARWEGSLDDFKIILYPKLPRHH